MSYDIIYIIMALLVLGGIGIGIGIEKIMEIRRTALLVERRNMENKSIELDLDTVDKAKAAVIVLIKLANLSVQSIATIIEFIADEEEKFARQKLGDAKYEQLFEECLRFRKEENKDLS